MELGTQSELWIPARNSGTHGTLELDIKLELWTPVRNSGTHGTLELDINSFCHQENDEEKNSVLIRFKQIYELRKTIIDFSKKHPQYRPPEMLFGEDTSEWAPAISTDDKAKNKGGKKGGAGKKSSRRKEAESQQVGRSLVAVSQAGPGGQTNTTTQQAGAGRESGGSIAHFRPFLREFDLDCLLAVLSHKSLTIEEEAEGTRFRPEEYLFVMEDLLSKLQHKVGTMKKKFPGKKFSISSFGFTNLSLIPASKVVFLVSDHLEHILAALDELFSHVQRLIANEDGVIDGLGMQSCGALLLQKCLLTNALKMSLLRIARRGSGDIASGADISSLAGAAVTHLIRFREIINTVDVAAAQILLVATMDSIDSRSSGEEVTGLANEYLGRDWRDETGAKPKGVTFNKHMEEILTHGIEKSKDVLPYIEKFHKAIVPIYEDINAESREFPFLTKSSAGFVFKQILSTLVVEAKKLTYGKTKNQNLLFRQWTTVVQNFVDMVLICKRVSTTNNSLLSSCLKFSKPFIDSFTKHGNSILRFTLDFDCARLVGCKFVKYKVILQGSLLWSECSCVGKRRA